MIACDAMACESNIVLVSIECDSIKRSRHSQLCASTLYPQTTRFRQM
jgi:hypothetical protein